MPWFDQIPCSFGRMNRRSSKHVVWSYCFRWIRFNSTEQTLIRPDDTMIRSNGTWRSIVWLKCCWKGQMTLLFDRMVISPLSRMTSLERINHLLRKPFFEGYIGTSSIFLEAIYQTFCRKPYAYCECHFVPPLGTSLFIAFFHFLP